MTEYENEYCSIGYDSDYTSCYFIYKRFGSSEEFRDSHEKLLEVFRNHSTHKLLIDTRFMGVLNIEDQEWIVDYVTPALIEGSGDKKYTSAMVQGEDVFAKFGVESIESRLESHDNYQVAIFGDIDSAKTWLKDQ